MAALKYSQSDDEVKLYSSETDFSTQSSSVSQDDLVASYRHFSKSLPMNVCLQHGTRYVAVALQKGILGTLADVGWRNREKRLFAERVAELIASDSFIVQASAEIGLPTKDETEDEFVERGKAVFRRLLRTALER